MKICTKSSVNIFDLLFFSYPLAVWRICYYYPIPACSFHICNIRPFKSYAVIDAGFLSIFSGCQNSSSVYIKTVYIKFSFVIYLFKSSLSFLSPHIFPYKLPLIRGKLPVKSRGYISSYHRSFYRYSARAAACIDKDPFRIPKRKLYQRRCQRFLYRSRHILHPVTSFMKSRSAGIHSYGSSVFKQCQLYRIFCSCLFKYLRIVKFFHPLYYSFFNYALACRNTVQF